MSFLVIDLARKACHNVRALFVFHDHLYTHNDGQVEGRLDDDDVLGATTAIGQGKVDVARSSHASRAAKIRNRLERPQNPIRLLALLKLSEWLALLTGFLAIYVDFFDYFVVAVQVNKLATFFHTSKTEVSTSIMLSMLTRVVGAILFGTLGDMVGRKIPLVLNCLFLGCMQIASLHCTTLATFLVSRAFFGIGMGGIWGCAAASLMEQCPAEAKGLLAGMLWSAGNMAYLTVAGLNMRIGGAISTWRTMFWIGAGLSFGAALVRACVPESPQFVEAAKGQQIHVQSDGKRLDMVRQAFSTSHGNITTFCRQFKQMIKTHWQTFIYCTVFVGLLSFASHASSDTYPTFLITSKQLSTSDASKSMMIANAGGAVGSVLGGYMSQFVGRRRSVIVCTLAVLALIPAFILPTSFAWIGIGGFFFLLFGNMANGVIIVHLNELGPPAFRAILSGTAYQLGTTISSPSAVIVNEIAEHHHVTVHGRRVEAYGPTIAIASAILYTCVAIWTAIGPEQRGADFENFVPAARMTALDDSRPDDEDEKPPVSTLA